MKGADNSSITIYDYYPLDVTSLIVYGLLIFPYFAVNLN